MKVAFVDRDGTIIKDYPDEKWSYIKEPEYLPKSIEGLKVLQEAGYKLIIVTNQYIINEGYITLKQYEEFTSKVVSEFLLNDIKLHDIFFCAHRSGENCACKKPSIGMLRQALAKYPEINLEESLMIGDSECDKEFARNGGLRFYGISGGSLVSQESCYNSIVEIALEVC